jgi:hypothetical protein
VFDGDLGGEFLGIPVRDVRRHADVEYDLIVVATMSAPATSVAELKRQGVDPSRIVTLRSS